MDEMCLQKRLLELSNPKCKEKNQDKIIEIRQEIENMKN